MHQLIRHSNADGSLININECGVCRAFLEGIGTHSVEDVFWRADGTFFETEYFSYPIRRGEEVLGAVVTFWDISERKQGDRELRSLKESLEKQVRERTAELHDKLQKLDKSQKAMLYMVEDLNRTTNELQEERKKLELSNRELEAFTYSVSHDLRAPLRAVNGYSQFLLEDYANKLDDEGKRFIRTIRENANRMDELISDLLNLSRVSRTELNLSLTDMAATAASMYQEVASDEEKKNFKLIIHKMPQVDCDPSLIKQVWQNLIGNALKYSMHAENKTIEIGHREEPEEIWFYIKDQGAGFNMKYVDKIFGLFQRLHREDEFEGTGVGLAIVKRIVQRHGGKVNAESEEGKGAAFYFSLPKTSKA
jgi:light-regulated signal transduction histidine kinase (bacteriophytochrome)